MLEPVSPPQSIRQRFEHGFCASRLPIDELDRPNLPPRQPWRSWSADPMENRVQEAHHRIKNSLQLVASMLNLQARAGGPASAALQDAARRVSAVARLHARLQASEGRTQFRNLLDEVVADLSQASGCEARNIRVEVQAEELELDAEEAAALGLIANELVTNSLKHGCPRGGETVMVRFGRRGSGYRLSVVDQGPGFAESSTEQGGSLGLVLVRSMVRRLNGNLSVRDANPGALVIVDLDR